MGVQQLRTSIPILMCTCLLFASASAATTLGRASPTIVDDSFIMSDATFGDCSTVSWLESTVTTFVNLTYEYTGDVEVATLTGDVLSGGFATDDSVTSSPSGFEHDTGISLDEGEHDLTLTLNGDGGADAETCTFGVDRTGPVIDNPSLSISDGWVNTGSFTWSDPDASITETGSGVKSREVRIGDGPWEPWIGDAIPFPSPGSSPLPESEDILITLRATDNVDNVGPEWTMNISVDRSEPTVGIWFIHGDLHTSRSPDEPIEVELTGRDDESGLDMLNSIIEYRFDDDGIQQEDENDWTSVPGATLRRSLGLLTWSTRQGQYLALKGTLVDLAGNEESTTVSFHRISPGLDLYWNSSSVESVAEFPGQTINITVELSTTEAYMGAVDISVESAPADREPGDPWVILESYQVEPGFLGDRKHSITFQVQVLRSGPNDVRFIIDPAGAIDERDEGNNEIYEIATGIDQNVVAIVPGFSPGLSFVMIIGLFASVFIHRQAPEVEGDE